MSKKQVFIVSSLVVVLSLFFLLDRPNPALCEEEPTISLVKTIEIRDFDGLKVNTDEYVVQKGDSIYKILHRRRVIGRGPMQVKMLKMIMAFNPDLVNPDLLLPGQKLILPEGPIKGLSPEPAAAPTAAEGPSLGPSGTSITDGGMRKVVKVRRGDTLSALLMREGIPAEQLWQGFINLTVQINPNISDPNLIYTGQEITLPTRGAWAEAVVAGRTVGLPKPATVSRPPTATRAKKDRTARTKTEKPKTVLPPPPLPPSESVGTRTALGLIFTRVGERFLSKGQHFLPLKTGGQVTISTKSFPIIELRSGHRIVLDLDQRLPKDVIEMIRANYANYTIFRPRRKEKLPGMLQRLFELGEYYQVYTKGESWTVSKGIKIDIKADWIVWPTQADWDSGRAVVVTLPKDSTQGTSPEIAKYLGGKGIQVIDFYPRGNLIGPEPRKEPLPTGFKAEDITPEGNVEFVQALLDLLGQKFEKDLSIPLVKNQADGQDFNFTIDAPIYFTRGGSNYLVDLDGISDEMIKLLKGQKFKVITLSPGEGPHELAKKLLAAMGIKTKAGMTVLASTRPSNQNIEVTIPGLLFDSDGKELLLTTADVPPDLGPLVARPGLRLVKYRIENPT